MHDPGEQLEDEELKVLADMLLNYGELTESIESLKKKAVEYSVERSKLEVSIQRNENLRTFVPNITLLKRVMRSIDRLPSEYKEKLEKLHII